jgi:p-methyltransferase
MKQNCKKQVLVVTGIPPVHLKELETLGVLLTPALYKLDEDARASLHITMPSLGAALIATVIANLGYPVSVGDWYLDKINFSTADVVGISGANFGMDDVAGIAQAAKQGNPHCIVVLGGPLSWSYSPDYILSQVPDLDFTVFGEGEETVAEFLECVNNGCGDRLYHIPGVLYRNDKRSEAEKIRGKIPAAAIPTPDWSLVDRSKRIRVLPVETARGCSYLCAFCSETSYWGKPVRFKTIPQILAEIETNIDVHGVNSFRIADSCFSAPEARCEQVCRALIAKFGDQGTIRWSSFARVNNLQKKELLTLMNESGCVALDIGMESGDQQVLNNMRKDYSPEMIRQAVANATSAGIFTHCNVVVGFPGETRESVTNTINVLNAARPDTYHCMLFDYAPNTLISQIASQFGLKGSRLAWEHSTMNSSQALGCINEILQKVEFSCLIPMGELVALFLTARGHSRNDVALFFQNIRDNKIGHREISMLDDIFRKNTLVQQDCPQASSRQAG